MKSFTFFSVHIEDVPWIYNTLLVKMHKKHKALLLEEKCHQLYKRYKVPNMKWKVMSAWAECAQVGRYVL